MEEVIQETPQKRGLGKVIVWIIIIWVILAAAFVVYKYVIQNNDLNNNEINEEGNVPVAGDNTQQQTGDVSGDEKPPKPPE